MKAYTCEGRGGSLQKRLFDDSSATLSALMARFQSILTVAVSTIAALALAEGALRASGVRFNSSFYELDFITGWALRPKAEGWQTAEGETLVTINSLGMRDRERTVTKPANTYRVAFVGDSFTESIQVPLEKTFPALLEGKCRPASVEALNFGVTGYGTAQELLLLRSRVLQFQPDLVVLVFFAGNDIFNNHRDLNPTNADAAPYYVLDNGKLQLLEASGTETPMRNLFLALHAHSRIVQTATEAYYNYQRRRTRANDQSRIAQQYGKDYMEWLAYKPPKDETIRQAWDVTEHLLLAFRDEVQSHGSKFLLVLANNAMQAHPDPQVRANFAKKYDIENLDYADNRVNDLVERNGIEVVWLAKTLRQKAEKTSAYFHGFARSRGIGHWNESGHQVVAETLAERLCPGQ